MPLYREWSINDHCIAAIWEIKEPEVFFTEYTGISPDIKNEKRRMERLAGRFLLKHLKDDFPLSGIFADEHDKPRIDNDHYYFSISHSWPYVAAMIDVHRECGIDIQTWHPRIAAIQHKFLSEKEQTLFGNDEKLITLAWCAKEAVYKWAGRRGVEFIEQMPIVSLEKKEDNYLIVINSYITVPHQPIMTVGSLSNSFSLSYVIFEDSL